MTCPKCQNINPETAIFCSGCGNPLQTVQPVAPVTPPQIPTTLVPPVLPIAPVPPPLEPEKKKPIPLFILLGFVVIGVIIGSSVFVYNKFFKTAKKTSFGTTKSITPSAKKPTPTTTSVNLAADGQPYEYPAVKIPSTATVQTEYKGIKFMRTPKSEFTEDQIKLLKYFIDMTPAKLLNPGPKVILTYERDEIELGLGGSIIGAVAFASGENIFFNGDSFTPTGGTMSGFKDTSIDQVLAVFIHELVHTAQFYSITPDFLIEAKSKGIQQNDLIKASPLVSDFAGKVGWDRVAEKNVTFVQWKLKEDSESQKTTDYGKQQGPQEDLADSVASYAMGTDYELSVARREWVKNWLAEDPAKLIANKLPRYENLNVVKYIIGGNPRSSDPTEDEFKKKYTVVDADLNLASEVTGKIQEMADNINRDLNARGWQGSLTKTADKRNVIIFKGTYTGVYRDLDVLVRSYDEATGYSTKPNGTQVSYIAGYKFP